MLKGNTQAYSIVRADFQDPGDGDGYPRIFASRLSRRVRHWWAENSFDFVAPHVGN